MRIERFRAIGWRNLEPLDFVFDPAASLHVLFGQNGQGKTNVIEALYFLSTFRSFRTTQAADLIRREGSEARIAVDVQAAETARLVEARLFREATGQAKATGTVNRTISVDGKPVKRVSAAFGVLSAVLFVPDDLSIHLGGRLAREHASQGQLRALLLALMLAELVLVGRARGETGVLLLDDVPSELDLERRRFLFETLTALGCQCVLSVADRGGVPAVPGRADVQVVAGRVAAGPAGQHFSLLAGP